MASKDNIARVWDAMEEVRLCMLTTREGSMLRSRPMAAYPDRHEDCVWFLADARAHKDDEIARNPDVNMAFADKGDNTYVSVSGKASVVRDPQKVKELWTVHAKAWFPNGPDDPNVILLRVTPGDAELWDGTSSSLVYAFETARAVITGSRPKVGEHAKVRL